MLLLQGLAVLLLFISSTLARSASLANPKEDCIDSPEVYTERLRQILRGDDVPRGSVCEGALFGRTDTLWPDQSPPDSLSSYGLMWVFVAEGTVLDDYLGFAYECVNGGGCDRRALLTRMMNYVGFDTAGVDDAIDTKGKSFNMVVVNRTLATSVWEYQPFQPTWDELYAYLLPERQFEVCNQGVCYKKQMPQAFYFTQDLVKDYADITGCDPGFPGPWPRADCDAYGTLKAKYEDSFCSPDGGVCGSPKCVDIYIDGPEGNGPSDDVGEQARWTRAFFEMCMGINKWFTGKGVGYDPEAKAETGNEWLVRGDIVSAAQDARYVQLYPELP